MAWVRTSIPVAAVALGGRLSMSLGSKIAASGIIRSLTRASFRWLALSVMTAYSVTSEPVPAVVGSAIKYGLVMNLSSTNICIRLLQ